MSDPVIEEAIGVVDGVNTDFDTPVAYQSGTVWLFLNGQLIPRENDDGRVIELGGTSVRLSQAPRAGDRVHLWFHTGPPTAGAFSQPPLAIVAIELSPNPHLAIDLAPTPKDATGDQVITGATPTPCGAVPLAPDPEVGIELTPDPLSAEEV